jgi:hypothetical protein
VAYREQVEEIIRLWRPDVWAKSTESAEAVAPTSRMAPHTKRHAGSISENARRSIRCKINTDRTMNLFDYSFTGERVKRGIVKGMAVGLLLCAMNYAMLMANNPQVVQELRLSTWLIVSIIFVVNCVLREAPANGAEGLFSSLDDIVRTVSETTISVLVAMLLAFSVQSADW